MSFDLTSFSYELTKTFSDTNSSWFVGPITILSTFTMVMLGAPNGLQLEIKKGLTLGKDTSETVAVTKMKKLFNSIYTEHELNITNRLFLQHGDDVNQVFANKIKEHFSCEVQTMDRPNRNASNNEFNLWVHAHTRGNIEWILRKSALGSTIVFKEKWSPSLKVNVLEYGLQFTGNASFMNIAGTFAGTVFQLPFQFDRFSCVIVFPNSGSNPQEMNKILSKSRINAIMGEMYRGRVDLVFFEFTLKRSIKWWNRMSQMGLTEIIHGDDIPLPGISDSFLLREAYQKSVFKFAAEGVEVAEVTTIGDVYARKSDKGQGEVNEASLMWIWDSELEAPLFTIFLKDI